MRKKLFFIPITLLLATILVAISCGCPEAPPPTTPPTTAPPTTAPPTTSAEPKILRIGLIYSMSGPFAPGLEMIGQGAEVCAEWINDEGGITIEGQKYTIELVSVDDKGSPEGAVAAANKLVYDENIKLIVDGSIPMLNVVKAQTTEEAGALRAVLSGGAPEELTSDMHYTFATNYLTAYYPPLYDYLAEAYPEVTKIAMVSPDGLGSVYAMGLAEGLAQAKGITSVFTEYFDVMTMDFVPLATRIVQANPDAVDVGYCIPVWGASIIKAVRELGFTGPVFGTSPLDPGTVMAIAGADNANNVFSACSDPNSTAYPPLVLELKARVEAKYGPTFQDTTTGGWTGLWSLAQAIEAAQSLDPTKVAEAWENMESVEALFGTAKMGGTEATGINHVVMWPRPLTRIDEGGVVTTVRIVTPRFAELD